MATKPEMYTGWVPDNAPTKVVQPPASQLESGFVPGEPPAAQYINWVLRNLDQWVQYLDQTMALAGTANAGALDNARLLGGGNWSFNLATSTLAWSDAFNIAMPGIDDADNQASAGSVVIPDGAVAYVNANMPFTTSANTQNGNALLTGIGYDAGVVAGQSVNGAGIPVGATIIAVGANSATMSAPATATATGVTVTFVGAGALTVAALDESALQPNARTIILARRSGAVVIVGTNAGEMILRDGETKLLRTAGFTQVYTGVAGETLTAGQAVYVSPGSGDGGRTANAVYKADASITNGGVRGACIGLVMTNAASGAAVQVVETGAVNSLTGLTVGATYHVSPTTPGALVAARPTTAGQWATPVGVAVSATQILVNTGAGSMMVSSGATQGTYPVFNETQLAAAIAASASAGGIIVIQGAFTIASAYTIPAGVGLIGQAGQAVITVGSGGSISLLDRVYMADVNLATAKTSGTMLSIAGNNVIMSRCVFDPPQLPISSFVVCVDVNGSGTRLRDNKFNHVLGGTATGINYRAGASNIEDSSVFA